MDADAAHPYSQYPTTNPSISANSSPQETETVNLRQDDIGSEVVANWSPSTE